MSENATRFPRENLIRAVAPGVELRAAPDSGMPTLFGTFTPFNRWAEIDSFWEGHFLERTVSGAFKKTFSERTPKVLFQHGMDPQIGDKLLGAPDVLREEDGGPYYEVPLLDTSYNRDLVPGLEAGLYGASYRFDVIREEWVEEPETSEHNPKGIPERTLREVRCYEFGPVTFPAFEDASAGVRSLTDAFIIGRSAQQPDRLRQLVDYLDERREQARAQDPAAPSEEESEESRGEPQDPEPDDESTPVAPVSRGRGPRIQPIRLAAPRQGLTPLHPPERATRREKPWLP